MVIGQDPPRTAANVPAVSYEVCGRGLHIHKHSPEETLRDSFSLTSMKLEDILAVQKSIVLSQFTCEDAFALGCQIRTRLLHHPKPVMISICTANSKQIIFRAVTHAGTSPDNAIWIDRKVNTVLRFGVPSFLMHCKFEGKEADFAAKYGLSPDQACTYAIHGGAVPVQVEGVEGIVAVVCVSGLKQDEDHSVVVEALQNFKMSFGQKV